MRTFRICDQGVRMIRDYDLGLVTVTDEYCKNAFDRDVDYLLSLDTDRLLAGFYENAGLTPRKIRYGGWENMLIAGHTMGHYLAAIAQGYASGEASEEQKKGLFDKVKACADGLKECQEHSQGKPGFVFGATVSDPSNVELQFDLVEHGKTNIITESWVPWYTMHKILDGLVKAYRFTGYGPCLDVASGIGDWTYNRGSGWSEETHRTVLSIEYGGMNDALYELYKCTGKDTHLQAAHMFDQVELFEKILTGEKNVLNNHHANTTIPKFLGALNRYMILGASEERYLEYVRAFWDMVVEKHTYATGGNSEWEHFGEDYVLDAERTGCNNETCNTHNMLKMTRLLFMITGERKYADYYENTFINAILSSINPESGMTMYFQPMGTGYYKVYGQPFDKFWCCTGTGMENFTKTGSSIYFRDDSGIYVNMYLSSELKDDEKKVILVQDSSIPESDTSVITVRTEVPAQFTLNLRIPDWAFGYSISVNGKEEFFSDEASKDDEYVSIDGTWNDGDEVSVKFVMKIVPKGLPDCRNVFAFKYGPVLLSADLGPADCPDSVTGVDVTVPGSKVSGGEYLTVLEGTYEDFIADADSRFERSGDPLHFILRGTDRDLDFSPHYLKTRSRYGIYWYFIDKSENADDEIEARKLAEVRRENIIDTVQPGYGQYENDELHAMEDNGSKGTTDNGTTRCAAANGSFTYHMKAAEGEDMILELHLLRDDNRRPLVISIGDEEIFNERLHYTGALTEYVREIPVSAKTAAAHLERRTIQTGDVQTLPITFRGDRYGDSARLFGFIYLIKKYR